MNILSTLADPLNVDSMAEETAQVDVPGTGWNDRQDAYRHCLASCEMTRRYGPGMTDVLGDANETVFGDWLGQTPEEREMDEKNNQCGKRSLSVLPALMSVERNAARHWLMASSSMRLDVHAYRRAAVFAVAALSCFVIASVLAHVRHRVVVVNERSNPVTLVVEHKGATVLSGIEVPPGNVVERGFWRLSEGGLVVTDEDGVSAACGYLRPHRGSTVVVTVAALNISCAEALRRTRD